jgi:hypothetical protein
MFERYTARARRAVFFARYEASQHGATEIEAEYLVLGLLREDRILFGSYLRVGSEEGIRQQISARHPNRQPVSTSVDLPLSRECVDALHHAKQEADRLDHAYIGTEHVLAGILQTSGSFAAKLLEQHGLNYSDVRQRLEAPEQKAFPSFRNRESSRGRFPSPPGGTVQIHGAMWNTKYVCDAVARCGEFSWHWQRQAFMPRDVVLHLKDGKFSFDMDLAENAAEFLLVKGGWTRDRCGICRWELFESREDRQHGTGYTNGREWICIECYENFFADPDFGGSAFSELP